jgi:hypothetical protein
MRHSLTGSPGARPWDDGPRCLSCLGQGCGEVEGRDLTGLTWVDLGGVVVPPKDGRRLARLKILVERCLPTERHPESPSRCAQQKGRHQVVASGGA